MGPWTLSACGPPEVDQSYWRRKSRYFPGRRRCRSPQRAPSDWLPVPVTRAWAVKGGHQQQWERNHTEQSIFSDTAMWRRWWEGGSEPQLFHHRWHLKDTPQCCRDNSYGPAPPAPLGVRSGLSDILSVCFFCSSRWCRLQAQRDAYGCMFRGVCMRGVSITVLSSCHRYENIPDTVPMCTRNFTICEEKASGN